MRIAKFIARSGLCSRRDAEKWIEQGRVNINNKEHLDPAFNINPQDVIKVDGKEIQHLPETKLWIYYKPINLITTHNDPQERLTVFDALKNKLPRVISIGRLDINSEGLLLLTNDGDLSRFFENPKNNIDRIYKVRVFGNNRPVNIQNKKITIDGVHYRPKSIKLTQKIGANSWYEVILNEGKNREIRKIFEHFGFDVNRLIRTEYGKYKLENLQPGEFKEVKIDENYSWKI